MHDYEGVKKPGAKTVTTTYRGVFRERYRIKKRSNELYKIVLKLIGKS